MTSFEVFKNVPILVERSGFTYPFTIVPIFVSADVDVGAITKLQEQDIQEKIIFVTTSKESKDDEYYDVGVIGTIMRDTLMPNGRRKFLFNATNRARLVRIVSKEPLVGDVEVFPNSTIADNKEVDAYLNVLRGKLREMISISPSISMDIMKTIDDNNDPNRIVDLILSILRTLKKDKIYSIYIQSSWSERLQMLISILNDEIETLKIEKEIYRKVNSKVERINKEFFLKEQLKQIQKELGVDTQRSVEIDEYSAKLEAKAKFMSKEAHKEIGRQIERLGRMHTESSEANMLQNYVDWMLDIPFGSLSTEKLSVGAIQKQLNKDHYALKHPKERILEYFSVRELVASRFGKNLDEVGANEANNGLNIDELRKLSRRQRVAMGLEGKIDELSKKDKPKTNLPRKRGAILCFYGPPGVGKTSLANSIATALKRPLIRIALGGLEDINELRGHRRTYVGAMPGRIIQGLIDAKTMDPLVVLDEVDKVGRSYRGDPTSVLLEILDPEQNVSFRDYYANFDVNLGEVIFIATANDISTIPPALRDRMEFIQINSYTPKEKFHIAKQYLIPQEMRDHALRPQEISITDKALEVIIEKYTREAGVRKLREQIATIMRKTAGLILQEKEKEAIAQKITNKTTDKTTKEEIKIKTEDAQEANFKVKVGVNNIKDFLRKIVFEITSTSGESKVGIVNGLAWTSVGGDVLKIEAIKVIGKGNLELTGNLGEVMRESAKIAFSVNKSLIDTMDAKQPYNKVNIHIHIPEGATPKDGPSAGIALACVIYSVLLGKKINAKVAMTGELTLSGEVLPIGGLKEKLIAAYKSEIKKVLIPSKNYERDLDDIPSEVMEATLIVPVKNINEVLEHALLP